MTGTKFNPIMLKLAREARNYSQSELGEKLRHSTHVNINHWEQNRANVSEDQAVQLSQALNFPIEFFYQEGEIYPPKFYRKRDKVPARSLHALDANINIYALGINRLLKSCSVQPHKLTSLPLNKYETPEKVAQQLRKLWKIEKGPIHNLTEIIERNNIIVAPIDFGTERVDGRSIITEDNHPLIFTNNKLLGDRLRFTLAYELGHLLMHTSDESRFSETTGHEANLFAAEFLMPEKDIAQDFKESVTLKDLASLKKKWKISMQSLLYRADSLKFIDYNQKRYLLTQFNQLQIRRREPIELDVPIEKPVLLKNQIATYRTKQKLSLTGIAKFFCLTEEEFLKRFAK